MKGHDFSRAASQPKNAWDLQAAEKLETEGDGGFIPRVKPAKSTRASAPEGYKPRISPNIWPFSAACLAAEGWLWAHSNHSSVAKA